MNEKKLIEECKRQGGCRNCKYRGEDPTHIGQDLCCTLMKGGDDK